MAKWQDYYGGSMLSAKKLGSKTITCKVIEVKPHTLEPKGGVPETRLHLVVEGIDDEIRLNATNAKAMAKAFGEDTDDWVGKRIAVRAGDTLYMGNKVKGLFIDPLKK